jgi:hypothetical protein
MLHPRETRSETEELRQISGGALTVESKEFDPEGCTGHQVTICQCPSIECRLGQCRSSDWRKEGSSDDGAELIDELRQFVMSEFLGDADTFVGNSGIWWELSIVDRKCDRV